MASTAKQHSSFLAAMSCGRKVTKWYRDRIVSLVGDTQTMFEVAEILRQSSVIQEVKITDKYFTIVRVHGVRRRY